MKLTNATRAANKCGLLFCVFALFHATPGHAAAFVVTSTADSGAGSLRAAIAAANAAAVPPHKITFSIAGAGPVTISLLTALPAITQQMAIDAVDEAISGAPGVRLARGAVFTAPGLQFAATADGSSVFYLSITGFTGHGIDIVSGATSVSVSNCYIGIAPDGVTDAGNSSSGVKVSSTGAVIGAGAGTRNVISGNGGSGIEVDSGGNGAVIRSNRIGTNAAGTAAVPNNVVGIFGTADINSNGAAGVVVGGTTEGLGNLISGNTQGGVNLNIGTDFWQVQGNFIGTTADGTAALGNGGDGISVAGVNHFIGFNDANGQNVISGNTNYGINLTPGANDITIRANFIGTNAAGTAGLGAQIIGVFASNGSGCVIGGTTANHRNVISGNSQYGVFTYADESNCIISGNYIGINAAGTAAIANGIGVYLDGSGMVLGGDTAGERNLISGNTGAGVSFRGSTNKIQGNHIGTNFTGAVARPNGGIGILVSATGGTIGGTAVGERNLISGNSSAGIQFNVDTSSVLVVGNYIGTNAAGTAALANSGPGVELAGTNNTLGGNTSAARNLISGNGSHGVVMGGTGNIVRGNYIGTDLTGSLEIGNGSSSYGVRIYAATGGQLGGATVAEGNLISGNARGVSLEEGSTGVVLRNNNIGLNAGMTLALPSHKNGVEVSASGNTIGTAGAGNVISGSSNQGILISGHASGNTVRGNWIGTTPGLSQGLGNSVGGIWITDGFNNIIGGQGAGEGNTIAYNGYVGVWIERGDGNDFSRNSIFENVRLGLDVGERGLELNDDEDPDLAGNRKQNFPLLTSVVAGATTEIDGILKNEPNTQYRVEFFTSPSCDYGGFGEGKTFFGTVNVTTGPGGVGVIDTSKPATPDPFMSATVTDPQGNTSEFSPCAKTTGPNPGTIQFYNTTVDAYEGVLPTAKVIITRSQGMAGTVTANFTVSNGSALAGSDYVDADQVVTFLDGEVLKIIEITIITDPAVETNPEHAALALSSPGNGALLGISASDLSIKDQDVANPGIIVDDASITEGNSGQTQLTFNVHLSASDHEVTMNYVTEPGTAEAGQDYTHVTGTIVFPASATAQTKTVNVPISGDGTVEPDEIVWLRLSGGASGGSWVGFDLYGLGRIVNDDGIAPPAEDIFKDGFENPVP